MKNTYDTMVFIYLFFFYVSTLPHNNHTAPTRPDHGRRRAVTTTPSSSPFHPAATHPRDGRRHLLLRWCSSPLRRTRPIVAAISSTRHCSFIRREEAPLRQPLPDRRCRRRGGDRGKRGWYEEEDRAHRRGRSRRRRILLRRKTVGGRRGGLRAM